MTYHQRVSLSIYDSIHMYNSIVNKLQDPSPKYLRGAERVGNEPAYTTKEVNFLMYNFPIKNHHSVDLRADSIPWILWDGFFVTGQFMPPFSLHNHSCTMHNHLKHLILFVFIFYLNHKQIRHITKKHKTDVHMS